MSTTRVAEWSGLEADQPNAATLCTCSTPRMGIGRALRRSWALTVTRCLAWLSVGGSIPENDAGQDRPPRREGITTSTTTPSEGTVRRVFDAVVDRSLPLITGAVAGLVSANAASTTYMHASHALHFAMNDIGMGSFV